jgi:hypothetical protein
MRATSSLDRSAHPRLARSTRAWRAALIEVAEICHERDIWLIGDAVQARRTAGERARAGAGRRGRTRLCSCSPVLESVSVICPIAPSPSSGPPGRLKSVGARPDRSSFRLDFPASANDLSRASSPATDLRPVRQPRPVRRGGRRGRRIESWPSRGTSRRVAARLRGRDRATDLRTPIVSVALRNDIERVGLRRAAKATRCAI